MGNGQTFFGNAVRANLYPKVVLGCPTIFIQKQMDACTCRAVRSHELVPRRRVDVWIGQRIRYSMHNLYMHALDGNNHNVVDMRKSEPMDDLHDYSITGKFDPKKLATDYGECTSACQ